MPGDNGFPKILYPPIDQSCVGHWKLNDNLATTNVLDWSSNDNDGTAQANTNTLDTTGNTGTAATALTFNGSSDYVTAASMALTATDNISMSGWFKPTNAATGVTQIGVYNGDCSTKGYYIRWRDNNWYFSMAGVNVGTGVTGNVGAWQHVAVVRSNGDNYLYLDGVSNSVGTRNPRAPTGGGTRIGASEFPNGYFDGDISDVRIYNRALTSNEVKLLYEAGRPGRWS